MNFTEQSTVENYIIEKLQGTGWQYIPAIELNRETYEQPVLKENLLSSVQRINNVRLTDEDLKKIWNKLEYEPSGINGSRKILKYIKEGVYIKLEETDELKRIKLIDEDPKNNEYIISNQVIYKTTQEKIIPDIVLFVNGIPLVLIECKNPTDPAVSWEDAYRQIKDYEKKVPELFKYVQFSIGAEETAKYFPNIHWLEDSPIYEWKSGEFDPLEATLEMFQQDILLDIIKNFTFIREEKGKSNKIMPRYLQYRASNKIVNRVINNLKGRTEKDSGLIWHWQGSGKTLTMIYAMYKLYNHPLLKNPTIFFVLDRAELEKQIKDEMSVLEIPVDMKRIEFISDLKDILLHDEGSGERGVFATLIQKFRKEEFNELEEELNQLKESGRDTILDRRNVITFIDEGHRSQYGTLASEMRSILCNAFFFAFTGTPIAKEGRDTFQVFSYPDEDYMDRYFIQESIDDGYTVPIRYQVRLEDKAHLDKANLDKFLDQELEEIPEEYREDVEDKTRKKLNTLNVMLKDPRRVEMVAEDVSNHFLENLDGKFKALLVAPDREACLMYKEALDKFLPTEYSEVVMSYNRNDSKKFREYLEGVKDRYHVRDWNEAKDRITEHYREDEFPKILIITGMLLTGFDAPILQTMYLDKPLKEHRLLQAIARTNRPYKGIKEAGLILDYVGIFDEFERTMAIYSKGDIEGAAYSIEKVKEEFLELLEEAKEIFDGIKKEYDRETLMNAVRTLIEKHKATEFQMIYISLKKKFELLGPDPFRAEYLEEFKWLTDIYYAYMRHVKRIDPEERSRYENKFFKKTIEYVHRNIDLDKIRKDFPVIEFNNEYLDKLEDAYPDMEGRISDISTTYVKFIKPERNTNPIYESISERVENILERWNQKKTLFSGDERREFNEEIYQDLKDALGNMNKMRNRQIELGMNDQEYYILLNMEKYMDGDFVEDARTLSENVRKEMFKNWTLQKSARNKIGRIIRRYILKNFNLDRKKTDKLYDEIMENLKASE